MRRLLKANANECNTASELRLRALQCRAVPLRQIGRRLVSALKKLQQCSIGIFRFPYSAVRQDKFSEIGAVEGGRRFHRRIRESRRCWISVGIERGIRNGSAARPESATADFVRVRLARHLVRQIRNTTWMPRR